MGIKEVILAPRSPGKNPFFEQSSPEKRSLFVFRLLSYRAL